MTHITLSHDMTHLIRMVKHFGSEISPMLIIIRVLAFLRCKGMFPRHNRPFILVVMSWLRELLGITDCTAGKFVVSHFLHFFVVVVVLVLQGKFGVLFYLIWNFFGFQTDDIELTILLVVNFTFIECQAIIPIAGKLRLCYKT